MPTTPILRVRSVFTGIAGSPFLCTMHIDQGPALADEVSTQVHSFWADILTYAVDTLEVNVQADMDLIDPTTGDITGIVAGQNLAAIGTSPLAPAPLGTQGQLNLRTGVYAGGREIRGKLYVPGVSEQVMANGGPSSTFNDAMVDAWENAFNGPTCNLVVYSPTHRRWEPIVSAAPSPYLARLTSRQR